MRFNGHPLQQLAVSLAFERQRAAPTCLEIAAAYTSLRTVARQSLAMYYDSTNY
jgi:hypothetical protein